MLLNEQNIIAYILTFYYRYFINYYNIYCFNPKFTYTLTIIIIIAVVVINIIVVRFFPIRRAYTGVTPVVARGDYLGVITVMIILRKIKHAIFHDINVSTKVMARVPFKKLHFLQTSYLYIIINCKKKKTCVTCGNSLLTYRFMVYSNIF